MGKVELEGCFERWIKFDKEGIKIFGKFFRI